MGTPTGREYGRHDALKARGRGLLRASATTEAGMFHVKQKVTRTHGDDHPAHGDTLAMKVCEARWVARGSVGAASTRMMPSIASLAQ